MKIIQVMPTVSFGDAVSNDARAICRVISEMGYKTGIYAENVDSRLRDPYVRKIARMPQINKDDIVIFNHSTGTDLCYKLPKMSGRKMMIYHNITPPHFFDMYSIKSREVTKYGYQGTEYLSDKIEYVMPVSEYNAKDLRKMGYNCPMFVRPILIPFEDYEKEPDRNIIEKYSDGYVNIVFVGRISPNKKQEDVIKAFSYYKKHINPKSRLILVGSDIGMERYSRCLKNYAEALMVDDVVFTGQISFRAILAFYRVATVFLCMSEHEGFCVPLAEAMFFKVPIVAYRSSAVPDTLGDSGVLLDSKDEILTAKVIDRIVRDENLRNFIIEKQTERLKAFSYKTVRDEFEKGLNGFIETVKSGKRVN